MKKQLASVVIGLVFLIPSVSYAATLEEQRHSLILQLITLIEQQIAYLQASLVTQEDTTTPTFGNTEAITAAITQLNQTPMLETPALNAFFGAVQEGYVNLVTNAPVDNITVEGATLTSYEEVNGDTVYRNTKDPAYTYKLNIEGYSGRATITSGSESIVRPFAK